MGETATSGLSDRFADAMQYAWQLHRRQSRRKNNTPYISHLLAVAALVMEHGGNEDEAIAALLHDAVEDQGGMPTAGVIEHRFGVNVKEIVLACSDYTGEPKPPWRQRKENLLNQLASGNHSCRLVAAADKLHNLRCVLADYRLHGELTWESFHGGKEGTLWFYREMTRLLVDVLPGSLTDELSRTMCALEYLSKSRD